MSRKYDETFMLNIEATRGRPEVLLETRYMCTKSCSVDEGKPTPTIEYQLMDRNSTRRETVTCLRSFCFLHDSVIRQWTPTRFTRTWNGQNQGAVLDLFREMYQVMKLGQADYEWE
ncbi:hypothetical protein SARC_03821 [Sphaeroforma arctica JP610]|uniref:Uncharacterized protein n=1 Tax=Sphaeroforma arctica JP610 TaxID=667725 RepID=A0A0L0G4D4_9EUKA|nr:hypothetical protein SARC_03821 [Sphaeroforma arctica JP610]KNC83957.1 hypothetical protein SARC_03821 [Sphaeroforma arctica JP610]|eukprot:XP_014157859.1 hypothetical protein SARC_03821 [Sphaeroforma arctica JP610]